MRATINHNIGAIIIGAALIVGLNFDRFASYAGSAFYHLSGQAAADEAAARERDTQNKANAQKTLALLEENRQHFAAYEAEQQAQKDEAKLRSVALTAAWSDFLRATAPSVGDIKLVQNSTTGDYWCASRPRRNVYSTPETIETADYATRDKLADGFITWINRTKSLGKSDWTYTDLKTMTIYGNPYACLEPPGIWRANR